MKVLYEGLVCKVINHEDGEMLIEDRNGNRLRVDESEVIVLANLNEDI